jgi:hypothetical protein
MGMVRRGRLQPKDADNEARVTILVAMAVPRTEPVCP